MSFETLIPMDDLRAKVGEEIGLSDWKIIDQDRIQRFADLTDDHHFIHIDPAAAAKTMFGGTIAHGFLTLSFLSPLAFATVPVPDDIDHAINYGFDRLRFTGAVPSGARVRARFALTQLREDGLAVTLYLKAEIEVEDRDQPALVADWILQIIRNVPT